MIGARHSAGSTISNGGECWPSNWVILGRRPWNPLAWTDQFGQKNGGFIRTHCRVSQPICQAKKASNRVERFSTRSLIALPVVPVEKSVSHRLRSSLFHPKFTLCRA